MIKLMLVDDQKSMIAGLKALLSTHEEFAVVATAGSGEEALETLTRLNAALNAATANTDPAVALPGLPDVILMDIRMPGMGGVQATQQIKTRFPQLTVLILTTFDDDDFIIDALHYGAAGYLLKDIGGKRLIESIYEALSGNLLLTGRVAIKLASNIRQKQPSPVAAHSPAHTDLALSEREIEIARYIVAGLTAREISAKTFLSIGTVKNYTSDLYAKLGVNDRSKAMILLREILKIV
jgi:DNA-binding NarL/FixJ family response regulator